jgi:uncharacterized protein
VNDPEEIRQILVAARTIAIVGCSPKPARPSHSIAEFLIAEDYDVIPVHPGYGEILGRTCYRSLSAIPGEVAIDIVDVFRRSDAVAGLAAEAISRGVRFFWMQEGVLDAASAARLEQAGIGVAMDRCILKEHRRLRL